MVSSGNIRHDIVRDAMLATDRAFYVPNDFKYSPYSDKALPIRIQSRPLNHVYALENCVKPILKAHEEGRDATVLVVGCGSGYLLAAFGRMGKTKVVGLEHAWIHYQMALKNFKVNSNSECLGCKICAYFGLIFKKIFQKDAANNSDLLNRVEIHHARNRYEWLDNSDEEIYDVIHIGLPFRENFTEEELKQLRKGGRLISEMAEIQRYTYGKSKFVTQKCPHCVKKFRCN